MREGEEKEILHSLLGNSVDTNADIAAGRGSNEPPICPRKIESRSKIATPVSHQLGVFREYSQVPSMTDPQMTSN
jgi:hypothetical protein